MRIVITYRSCGKDEEYLPLFDMAFARAKQFDYNTLSVGDYKAGDNYLPIVKTDMPLMTWILTAQLAFIESEYFDQPSVLFSPDALIIRRLEPAFHLNFDVMMTDRRGGNCPVNNGVIYLKPGNKEKIAEYWKKAIVLCNSYSADVQAWGGDQLAIYECFAQEFHRQIGLNVGLGTCRMFNAPPDPNIRGLDKELLNFAFVAHFKGKRKNLMEKYYVHLSDTRPPA